MAEVTQKAVALQLVRGGGRLPQERDLSPVRVYLASLGQPKSKESMLVCLKRAARLMGAASAEEIVWGALRYAHVELLKERMKTAGYEPATINVTLSALKGVAKQAWLLGGLGMSVDDYQRIAVVKPVRASRDRRGRALSGDELAALLKACESDKTAAGPRDACLVALLSRGGLRREEAVGLSLEDFDRRDHSLLVRGKGDRERTVFFRRGGARRALLAWLRARGDADGALLCPVDKSGRVEVRRMTAQAVYKALSKRARQAQLTRAVTPHDLRRTLATHLLDRGVDLSLVQQLLGHADVSTTTIYDRRSEDAQREALDLLPLEYRKPRRRKGKRGRGRRK
ncbi:MAG TPA: tyrosine-type recombinase/integrase [Pyrinomonadaceae bacterium]|nr:tyrosine-type recombinase/integrase [Pyrinomonadaceae bacterium]